MELVNGRPENEEGRLEKEIRVYDLLDSLGVKYQRIDHEAAMTMEACEEIDRTLSEGEEKGVAICKTKYLSAQIGSSRLSFAKPEYMERYLDITPGSVSIMGLMNDHENKVQLLIDEDVLKDEWFGCHPCINTSSLKIQTKDLVEKIIPAMGHEPKIVKL